MLSAMDSKVIAWARAVKARHPGHTWPAIWLFTDAVRLPDPRPVAARLPRGAAGIVLRHDADPARAALGRDLARICRDRRLVLVVAGDARLAVDLGAGLHLRAGRRAARAPGLRPGKPRTASAHGRADLVRARHAGADLVFLSPIFPTASHPGAPALGPIRWAVLARAASLPVLALGGVGPATVRRLPRRFCAGAGAIGAFS